MRLVWSLWSPPLERPGGLRWGSTLDHLLSWVLSFHTVARFYPDTSLVTDVAGARLLVDRLGIGFGRVSTALETLRYHDPAWWALGKIVAYELQDEPFLHVDHDILLWQPLPERLLQGGVITQHPEWFIRGDSVYRPEVLEHHLRVHGGWLPKEIEYDLPVEGRMLALCCGIMGGLRVDFLRHYARQARRLLEDPHNQRALRRLPAGVERSLLLEQYLLGACIRYHRGRDGSPFADVESVSLFESDEDAHAQADEVGFTHFIGPAKQHPEIVAQLHRLVRSSYPEHYDRCVRAAGSEPRRLAT